MAPVSPAWLERGEHAAWGAVHPFGVGVASACRHLVRWGAAHTGLPAIVVAALAVVLFWRVARRTWQVVFELAVAFGLLLAATKLGWIRW